MLTRSSRMAVAICLCLLLGEMSASGGEDKRPPASPKPPEWKVLDRLVGQWDSTTTSNVAEWTPEQVHTTGRLTRKWALADRFVRETARNSDGVEAIVTF